MKVTLLTEYSREEMDVEIPFSPELGVLGGEEDAELWQYEGTWSRKYSFCKMQMKLNLTQTLKRNRDYKARKEKGNILEERNESQKGIKTVGSPLTLPLPKSKRME